MTSRRLSTSTDGHEMIRMLGGYEAVPTNNATELQNSVHSHNTMGAPMTQSNVMQMSTDGRMGGDGWHSRASTAHTAPVVTTLTRMGSWVELGVSIAAPLVFGSLICFVGYRTLDECKSQPLLPVWLVVYGGMIMMTALLNVLNKVLFTIYRFLRLYKGQQIAIVSPTETQLGRWVGWFEFCVVLPFLAVWTIFGGVWVFDSCGASKCESCSTECNPITYYTVFWIVVGCSCMMLVAWAAAAVLIAVSIIKEQKQEKIAAAEQHI